MKNILGLDIGVSSVGLAVVKKGDKTTKIEKLAVRIVPEDPDFHGRFYSGNTASKNLGRTEKRGTRRNNQRFKQRRDKLYEILKINEMFPTTDLFQIDAVTLYGLRAKGVEEKLTLMEFGRVLIHLNQRRGFLSNRKSNSEEENSSEYKQRIAELEEELSGRTIGQQLYSELLDVKLIHEILLRERTYMRASYLEEFDRIWDYQRKFYPDLLTGGSQVSNNKGTLYDEIRNKTIYLQRPLKSQKGLVSNCLFEKHHKAISKSSPYFELFRIWQKVNDLSWKTSSGEKVMPSQAQKEVLFEALFYGQGLNGKQKLTISNIKKLLGYGSRERIYLNFTELDGSVTYSKLKQALEKAGINSPEQYLFFNLDVHDEKGGLFELWHITYSLPTEEEIVNTLKKRFNFNDVQSKIIANSVHYSSDYGSLSTRAIRKLLPHMKTGSGYSQACDKVGYDHSGYKTKVDIQPKLKPIKQNSLRNPVVEQILNQVVNMVNLAIEQYGPFDEIRVELARELRNNAKNRRRISQLNSKSKRENESIRSRLQQEYHFKLVSGRDIKRYKLWQETGQQCMYCFNPISAHDFLNGQAEIEHILPRSRAFNDSMSNFILAHRKCNDDKGQRTAYDFMESKGPELLGQYIEKVNNLFKDGKGEISKRKFENLLCKGEDIPSDFVERMKNDSQYISSQAVKLLKSICENTFTTTGQVTDLLRKEWGLIKALQDLNHHKYKKINQIEVVERKRNGHVQRYENIKNWSKRDDHRHHAIDALICALTSQKIIFKLNNLNKIFQYEQDALSSQELEKLKEINKTAFDLKEFIAQAAHDFPCPIEDIRTEVKQHLDDLFISFKKNNSKVLTPNVDKAIDKKFWTPRGRLHEETVMGQVKRVRGQSVKLSPRFELTNDIVNPEVKQLIKERINRYNGESQVAFSAKRMKSDPILYKGKVTKEVQVYETVYTKRVPLNENITAAQIEKIVDSRIKKLLKDKIEESGSIKTAFQGLNESPIWLNPTNRIRIKKVTVYDESKVISISNKNDFLGNPIKAYGQPIPTGFVKTGGNHHALIYLDSNGKFNNKVVSFWEAVGIGLVNVDQTGKPYPIINRKDDYDLGNFLFSIQINDLFVFDLIHSENPENPNEVDFYDCRNRCKISESLFRVQKMSEDKNGRFMVSFRHHLETQVIRKNKEGKAINENPLKGVAWEVISKNSDLARITKLRLNHLGEVVKVGE